MLFEQIKKNKENNNNNKKRLLQNISKLWGYKKNPEMWNAHTQGLFHRFFFWVLNLVYHILVYIVLRNFTQLKLKHINSCLLIKATL